MCFAWNYLNTVSLLALGLLDHWRCWSNSKCQRRKSTRWLHGNCGFIREGVIWHAKQTPLFLLLWNTEGRIPSMVLSLNCQRVVQRYIGTGFFFSDKCSADDAGWSNSCGTVNFSEESSLPHLLTGVRFLLSICLPADPTTRPPPWLIKINRHRLMISHMQVTWFDTSRHHKVRFLICWTHFHSFAPLHHHSGVYPSRWDMIKVQTFTTVLH